MSTQTSSTSPQPSNNWPANAIPQKWVERLFSRMGAFYGARFLDLWRGADLGEVKLQWALELHKISAPQIKAGLDNLAQISRPPTLPEFIAHCKQCRIEAVASEAPQLPDGRRASAETVGENMPQIKQAAMRTSSRNVGAVDWAFEMIIRGTARNGAALSAETRRHAEDAILSGAGVQAANLNDEFAVIRRSIVSKRREVAA